MWMYFRSLSEEIQEKGRKNRQVYIVWKVVKNSENNVDQTASSRKTQLTIVHLVFVSGAW